MNVWMNKMKQFESFVPFNYEIKKNICRIIMKVEKYNVIKMKKY